MDNLATILLDIGKEYRAAEQQLDAIRARMKEVEAAGMYPAIPTERWKDDKYLYMCFSDLDADKLTLDAKGRVYIGANPAKIEEARRLVSNRRQWESLKRAAQYLERHLDERESNLKHQLQLSRAWSSFLQQREPGAVTQLGLDGAG